MKGEAYSIGLALKHQAWVEAGGRGLTPTQGQVLALLRANPAGLRLGALADLLGVTAAAWPDFLLEAVDELSGAEQAAFLRSLVTMIRTLPARGRVPVARMCVSCRFFQPFRHPDPRLPHHCAFVDAPFGDGELGLDCPDHLAAPAELAARTWEAFRPTDPRRDP